MLILKRVVEGLNEAFPDRGNALIAAIQKINVEGELFPKWRENQLIQIMKAINSYVRDTNERYASQRLDSVASSVRNLLELNIWVRYCNVSQDNARTFVDDSARDLREMMDTIRNMVLTLKGKVEDEFAEIQNNFRTAAQEYGVKD
ncbi:MAG: hypothetical protein WB795_03580 [Candidatus Acidiferrales bacterium]